MNNSNEQQYENDLERKKNLINTIEELLFDIVKQYNIVIEIERKNIENQIEEIKRKLILPHNK